jgi:hypothetical protein
MFIPEMALQHVGQALPGITTAILLLHIAAGGQIFLKRQVPELIDRLQHPVGALMPCLHEEAAAILDAFNELLGRDTRELEFRLQLSTGILKQLQQSLLPNLLFAFLHHGASDIRQLGQGLFLVQRCVALNIPSADEDTNRLSIECGAAARQFANPPLDD